MSNRLLNDPSAGVNAAAYSAQARPDAGDVDVWAAAWARTGVVSGCGVTQRAAGANMSVDVAAGLVVVQDVPAAVSGINRAIGVADGAFPRIDLIVASNMGVVTTVPGAPASRPNWPLIPANNVVLATIFVPPGLTAVTNQEVLDKRVFLATRLRQTAVYTTASLANGSSEQGTVVLATGFRLLSVATDKAARVRLYNRTAKQSADLARAIGTDLTGDHGVVLEYVTTPSVLSATLSPEVDGHSMEATPVSAIPITVTNMSGTTGTVATTFTLIATE
jgi:hypothetical protein